MKKTSQRILLIAVLGILLYSAVYINAVAADGPKEIEVGGNKHQENLTGNSTNKFTFQNRFKMQIRVNQSLNISINCDDPNLANREFEMDLNTSEPIAAEITIRTENSEIGLKNGSLVQNRNRLQYRYQEQFMINVSLNESVHLQARLALKMGDSNATWAYYDEESEEFVPVESSYQNGQLVAYTDHFSSWTILTLEEESDSSLIPGYLWLGTPSLIGIGIAFLIIRKKRS
ncbi:hypothetical protein [Candidatus Harpocratesius sp.]